MRKSKDTNTARLLAHCSTDQTRFGMQGIYQCPKAESAVTTDGHRLFSCKALYLKDAAGHVSNSEVFSVSGTHVLHAESFPEYFGIVSVEGYTRQVHINVPRWVSKVKPKDGAECSILYGLTTPILQFGGTDKETAFNLAFLAPFAADTVTLLFHTEKGKPFYVLPAESVVTDKASLLALPWYALIMPLRCSNTPCSYLSESVKRITNRILKGNES